MDEHETWTLTPESIQRIPSLSISDVYDTLRSRSDGLTEAEATEKLAQFGANTIQEVKGKSMILRFLSQFTHMMAILLWVGGIVAFVARMPELGVAIWLVNVINGLFSFWQEFQAEKATEALKQLLPAYARVIRGGEEKRILAQDLVPGDVILLAEGDKISADCRLVDGSEFMSNQSTLTGESNPVHKAPEAILRTDMSRSEYRNLIFAGTNCASGTGKAVVYSTGMNTEFGKIASLTQNMEEAPSPLQKELNKLTRLITFMATSIGGFFFVAAILFAKVDMVSSFIFALGMIVAFVPEGMLPTVTLSLALGVQRMAKHNALIKKLSAVETLGCTTVICTDKTGTLTQNEMTVSDLWLAGRKLKVTGVGYAPEGQVLEADRRISADSDADVRQLLVGASLCSNARLLPPEGESNRWTVLGDPTEACLGVSACKAGIDVESTSRQMPRIRELPFESRRKRMSTIHQVTNASAGRDQLAFVKGAPKEVLDLCTRVRANGSERDMTDLERQQIMDANDEYARNGLRVLAVAQRQLPQDGTLPRNLGSYTVDLIERDLTFLGLIAMADPPRPEVANAVEECRHAGIRIIMITGDYGLTAETIARRIGIVRGERVRIVTGFELQSITDAELKEALKEEIIFARVAPEQKLQVVTALQEMGHVVAVTGDGVNDSPALKKADIGVAMGIAGTDVAKEAADMILTDDNFASIVHAIEEGRAVFNNIRKFAVYVFNSNMPEAVPFIIFLFSRGLIPLPLTVMQILCIDLGTDMIPAIGLGAETPEAGIMDKPPRSLKEPLITRKLLVRAFLWYGIMESAVAMLAYYFLNWQKGWPGVALAADGTLNYRMATMMTLAGIVFCQIGVVFCARTDRASIFKVGFFGNRLVLIGIGVELTLLAMLSYLPFLHGIFNTAPLRLTDWAFLAIWPPVIFLIDEARKWFMRRMDQRKAAMAGSAIGGQQ